MPTVCSLREQKGGGESEETVTTDEREKLLDAIDRRLALGEIDIGTYNTLKAKFSQGKVEAQDPVGATVAALSKEAAAIRCPGCMAPMPAPKSPSETSVSCEYCGSSFVLQTAASEMEELKSGIRKWVSELAGTATGGSMDQAARGFIFREKILPSLKTAADRATEVYAFGRHQALFSTPLVAILDNSPFAEAINASPDVAHLVDKLKTTIVRVQAPEVMAFAMNDKDKAFLANTEVQCQEIIYLTNARKNLASFEPDGLQKCIANLEGLESLYKKAEESGKGSEPALAKFAAGMGKRARSTIEAVNVLRELMSPSDQVLAGQVADKLDQQADDCMEAAQLLEQSGLEPRQTVPAAEGARSDAETIRMFASTIRLFGLCGAEIGQSFAQFQETLTGIIALVQPRQADLQWLGSFLSTLYIHIAATTGDANVQKVDRFDWAEARATSGVRKSLFGGAETVTTDKKLLSPFWIARLAFSQQSGFIFKKGAAAECLFAVDATHHDGTCGAIEPAAPVYNDIQTCFGKDATLSGSYTALAPTVTADSARKKMKMFLASDPKYAGGIADIKGLVYLPVTVAKYASKKEQRSETLLPFACAGRQLQIATETLGSRRVMFAK